MSTSRDTLATIQTNSFDTDDILIDELATATENAHQKIINNIFSLVKPRLDGLPINLSSLHELILIVMEVIETSTIKGTKQRDVAVKVISIVIKEYVRDYDDEQALLLLIHNGTIANLIDIIVDASKGKLNINSQTVDVAVSLSKSCLPLCFRKCFGKK